MSSKYRDYGRLSVMIQHHCRVDPLFRVGPGAFRPAPKVDSAIVRLTPRLQPDYPLTDHRDFSQLVRQAFSQRRKTLRNTLKGLLSDVVIHELGIDPSARPETITMEQYVRLANRLSEDNSREAPT
jgi:16S rRNA (adenine1518-N6/adenine1519-N6)-dimethyltransferase